ncbi:Sec23/Sec24 trunk domain protein (macronuclear) [Tetrahymena thermophila SB210]|uniref:Sec23/Sec24 trunk domain protein n=1 Tax=Tetrahymena thermophila (strain SB210) TaxID=312017 RepID=I7MLS2_TETTS|nr:Sec23/Sec24 trunk domain protein [Tetrahymena thermophila SB210]EAS02966.1 Sec23/Sec24 trunk domain protein [Tetrahymena thermophila SB210]|eukprot:XP_001023211.1 Sec23/Sec24 trunk domain protein [Tetrahymena thermophila SB210]
MQFGSKQCWLKPKMKQNHQPNSERVQLNVGQNLFFQPQDDNLDTNIVTISFDSIKQSEQNLQMGDPIFCKGCKAVLSKISKLEENKKKEEGEKVEIEEEENKDNKQEQQQIKEELEENGNMIWNCEFCKTKNVINIEREELPQQEDVIYMVQSVNMRNVQENAQNFEEENTIVFVIDVSGSMSVTAPIKNKDTNTFKHSTMVSSEEFEMLKQFMDEEDIYQYTQMQQQQNFVSRKQCVLAAIQQQMEDLAENQPNKKIGLIIFNNEVTIYGSGFAEPVVITGDKLYRTEEIYQVAAENSQRLFNLPVKQSKNRLIEIFDSIKEKGQTALGPAIVAALGVLSQQKKGSQIIVCTDGLANVGVGSFEDQTNYIEFYEDVKLKASQNDSIFNIISIKGEGCKLDILGSIADKTGGNVMRVDPDNLHKDFANILQDEVVALKAEMTIYLNNLMKFRNTDPDVDKVTENGSKCVKFVGNATKKTLATFEYTNKTDEEVIQQKLEDNTENIKELPFQCQTLYYNLQGHKMIRVLTKNQEITFDKKVAEKNLNYQVINTRVATHTAQLIQNNNYQQARHFNRQWADYVTTNEQVSYDNQQMFTNQNAQLKNVARKKQQTYQKLSQNNFSIPKMNTCVQQVQPQSQQILNSHEGLSVSDQKSDQLFQTASFSNPENGQNNQQEKIFLEDENQNKQEEKPIQLKESQKQQINEEDMFSGDEEFSAEEDELEAYMYQQKNNKF